MTVYDMIDSPIGQLLVTADDDGLTGIYMENHKGGPAVASDWRRDPSKFREVSEQLRAYFAGELTEFNVPLNLRGTQFQKAVWTQLQTIPFGHTATYGDLAKTLGAPNASRAVGSAVGRNPVSIVVPCHRVLGAGGAITGYAGGVTRKRTLLELESALRSPFLLPG
jgi:methylated-DNA-[protein]-cysteine S-methyltransferase